MDSRNKCRESWSDPVIYSPSYSIEQTSIPSSPLSIPYLLSLGIQDMRMSSVWLAHLYQQMKNEQSQTSDESNIVPPQSSLFPSLLIRPWQFYARRRGKHAEGQSYQRQQLTPLATVRSLEQFFCYYCAMRLPSEYEVDVKVMLFEEKCAPRWEEWLNSGCLLLQFKDAKEPAEAEALDQIWEYLLFGLVGNQLDRDIIGACLSKHEKQTLLQVWLRGKERRALVAKRIQELIQRDLHFICAKLKRGFKLNYKDHRLSMEHNSTMKGTQKITAIHTHRSNQQL